MDLLDSTAGRALGVLALLALASLVLVLARRRDGVFRSATTPAGLSAADLGRALGERATIVQFSAPTCATCPQVSRVLGTLASELTGVVHVEVDAVAHPDLARRLGVLRTPTVLLLGPHGDVRTRASGPLDRPAAVAALELAVRGG